MWSDRFPCWALLLIAGISSTFLFLCPTLAAEPREHATAAGNREEPTDIRRETQGLQSEARQRDDPLPQARSLSDRAMTRMGQGQFELALEDLRQAQALASGMNASSLLASIHYRTGTVLQRIGRNEEALERYRSAVELSGGYGSWLAVLAGNQAGEVLNRLGRHQEALETLSAAQEFLEKLDRVPGGKQALRARLLANSGVSRFKTGDFPAAVDSFQEAVLLFQEQGAEKEVSITRLHLANTFAQLARFRESEDLYRQVAERAGKVGAEKERGDGLSGLGLLLQYQGRQEEALEALFAALDSHEACGDAAGAARDRVNLAAVYWNRNDPGRARRQYIASLEVFRDLGRIPDQGFVMACLGGTSLLAGRVDRAEAELQAALNKLSACACPSERAVAHELAGRVRLQQGRSSAAAAHFTTALDLAESMGRLETVWRASAGLGDVYSRGGDHRSAAVRYLQSVEAIESVRQGLDGPDLQELYLYDKLHVYNALVRTLLLLNEKYAALESLDRRNQWIAGNRLSRTPPFDSPKRRAAYEKGKVLTARVAAIGEELRGSRTEKKKSAAWVRVLRERMASAEQELKRYLKGLEGTDPILHRGVASRPLDMKDLASRLPEDTAVIAYFLDGEDCHAFSLTAGSLHVTRRPGAREFVEKTARVMRDAVRRPPSERTARNDRAAFQEASRSLYDFLIAPLDAEVHRKTRWYILPDEALWAVSFNALMRENAEGGDKYLAQDHQIALVNTLEDVPHRSAVKSENRESPRLRVAAFGDAQRTLPAAAAEVRLLRNLDPEARIFSGEAATEQNARRHSRDANILVFASHATRPPSSESAHICLTPFEGEDGRLTAPEIRAWDLEHVDLVVLSGCGTALSFDRERTFLSLADAFLFAGARAVLATLWDISDPGTHRFMERFIGHWKQTGNHARALRLAQTECIEKKTFSLARVSPAMRNRYVRVSDLEKDSDPDVLMDMSHPFYWATFVLIEYGLGSTQDKASLIKQP